MLKNTLKYQVIKLDLIKISDRNLSHIQYLFFSSCATTLPSRKASSIPSSCSGRSSSSGEGLCASGKSEAKSTFRIDFTKLNFIYWQPYPVEKHVPYPVKVAVPG